MRKKTTVILSVFLVFQILGLQILKHFPEVVEKYYSQGVYIAISKSLRFLFGWIPFSVGDLFYTVVGILAIRWIYKNFRRWRKEFHWLLLEITAVFSVIYFIFHLFWGLNYYRKPLHEFLQIKNEYTQEELIQTTRYFIEKSNFLHQSLVSSDSLIVPIPYSQKEFYQKTSNGYKRLQKEFPHLSYAPKSIKNSLYSLPLTYMGYSGYLNPFSGEAQVNSLIATFKFPVVACHEEAHQIGFAAENEANFIATLATLYNEDQYIQYAGSIFALQYLLVDVARNNPEQFEVLRAEVAPGILESYRKMNAFWEAYENPFEIIFTTFWDNFLKASNQSQGIRSYSYVVALLVNYDFDVKSL